MQIISQILKITGGSGSWVTQYDKRTSAPEVVVGVAAKLRFDLRRDEFREDQTLMPYAAGELSSDTFYLVLDMDYDQTTAPKLLLSGNVELTAGPDGETYLDAVLPNTASAEIVAALAKQKTVTIHGEIGGYSAVNGAAMADWVVGFDLTLRNRVWLGGEVPPEVSGDPEYLTAVQVQALIAEATRSEVPGKSAYQIAVDSGFEGSETEWLASLKGEPGEQGSDLKIDATGDIEELNDYAGELKGFVFACSAYDDTRRATVVSLYAKKSDDYGDWCTPVEIVYYEKPAVVTALEPVEFDAPEDGAAYLTFSLKDYPSAIISQIAVDITPEGGDPYELLLPHGLASGIRRIEHDRSSGECRIYFGASVPEFTHGRIYLSEFLGVKEADISTIPGGNRELSGMEEYNLSAMVGESFSQSISVISATGQQVTLALTSGILPDGLKFENGKISGTPTASGNTVAVITATSASGARLVIRVNFTVAASGTVEVLSGETEYTLAYRAGQTVSQAINVTSSTGQKVTLALTSGTLPDGLKFENNKISGVPTAEANRSVVITATSSSGKVLVIEVNISVEPETLSGTDNYTFAFEVGQNVSRELPVTSSAGLPITYALTSGTLPGGLKLDGSRITGTPTAETAESAVIVTATSSSGMSKEISLKISVALDTLSGGTGALTFEVGETVTHPLAVTSSTGLPVSYELTSGSLPAGLSFANGTISGKPTAVGNSTITLVARSSSGATKTITVSVTVELDKLTGSSSRSYTYEVGKTVSQTVTMTSSTGLPVTYEITSGSLPAGLSFSDGRISGKPTSEGSSTLVITARSSSGATATVTVNVTVNLDTLTGTASYKITGDSGKTITPVTLAITSSTGLPVTYAVTSGSLPGGVSLSNGVISGTPTTGVESTVTITATSSSGATKRITVTFDIEAPPAKMYWGYLNDGSTSVTELTSAHLNTLSGAEPAAMGKTEISAPPGAVIIVAIPSTSSLKAYKDDGFGGKVSFDPDIVPGSGSNGSATKTLDGITYKLYGEFNLVDAPTYIYVE